MGIGDSPKIYFPPEGVFSPFLVITLCRNVVFAISAPCIHYARRTFPLPLHKERFSQKFISYVSKAHSRLRLCSQKMNIYASGWCERSIFLSAPFIFRMTDGSAANPPVTAPVDTNPMKNLSPVTSHLFKARNKAAPFILKDFNPI